MCIRDSRKSVGLSELKVTAEQMAIAQSDSNYSDATKGHSDYAGFENAAWNFSTKENIAHQWVDGEKKIFDDAAAKAGLGNVAPKMLGRLSGVTVPNSEPKAWVLAPSAII